MVYRWVATPPLPDGARRGDRPAVSPYVARAGATAYMQRRHTGRSAASDVNGALYSGAGASVTSSDEW